MKRAGNSGSDGPGPGVPLRPLFADHAAARRHLADGAERVVVCDERDGSLIELGWREWTLLRCADGTRDVEGIARAAAAEGAGASPNAVGEFFAALASAGIVCDAAAPPIPHEVPQRVHSGGGGAAGEGRKIEEADVGGDGGDGGEAGEGGREAASERGGDAGARGRLLEPLPGYGLHCDASGECCRIYPSVYFTEPETARARAALPDVLDGGARPARVFLPVRGPAPRGLFAVACVDGACAYLRADGLCGVHAAAGGAAKPAGCRLYPASYVDDGERVRVSVAAECPCVFRSAGREGGEPLVPPGARTRADLDPAAYVFQLPARVSIASGVSAPREHYVVWTHEVLAAPDPDDAIASGFRLADALETAGLRPGAATEALRAPRPPSPAELYPWLEALYRRAARAARELAGFRAQNDRARCGARWLAAAAETLLEGSACARALAPDPTRARPEAFALRAAVHGHQLPGRRPLADALRERAVRALVARAVPAAAARERGPEEGRDRWCAEPLALVNALMRGHGLASYADELVR